MTLIGLFKTSNGDVSRLMIRIRIGGKPGRHWRCLCAYTSVNSVGWSLRNQLGLPDGAVGMILVIHTFGNL